MFPGGANIGCRYEQHPEGWRQGGLPDTVSNDQLHQNRARECQIPVKPTSALDVRRLQPGEMMVEGASEGKEREKKNNDDGYGIPGGDDPAR